ncbi:BP74-related protein [Embleya sp. MST-111070]|uniref:BP74-related protein n=1 Tax=Embleya sp. MST-111070 TaxID=3398231 RepID=UPI003F740077
MAQAHFAFRQRSEPEEFIIELTDDAKIAHARKILLGEEKDRVHVHGRIIKRTQPYNPKWSFHLDPSTIDFFEVAIEVCDATMRYTEDHLDEACGAFLPGCHWCPWDSMLVREVGGLPAKKIADGWAGLKGTAFATGIDAACGVPGSATDLYLFKGNQYVRYQATGEKVTVGPKAVADGWAGLKGTAFATGIDAACGVPGSATDLYLFKGNQYLRYRTTDEKVTSGPKAIADGWSGLKGTDFANGVDAACSTPGSPLNVYLFKGSRYVEYKTPDEKIVTGPKSIADTWQVADGFAAGLDEVCRVPGHATDIYFFKGDGYARGR